MPEDYWVDGIPYERELPEERTTRLAEEKQAKLDKKKRVPGEIPKYIKARKEGMDLENRVTARWNTGMGGKKKAKESKMKQRPSLDFERKKNSKEPESGIQVSKNFSTKAPDSTPKKKVVQPEAKRQPNSGAMWYAKGDVLLDHALMEVKERGSKNARGEKTISVPKEWLTKQADEAFQERRDFWYLGFAYKNDDEIYLIKPYDHEIELIKELRRLDAENKELKSVLAQQSENVKED